jgi:hypothetical protein
MKSYGIEVQDPAHVTGIYATAAEINTGTEAAKAIAPDQLTASGPTLDHLHLTNSLVAGTTITATLGDITATHGNFVVGTAGHGIDFSADANAAGMTSELLDDYEEGTWTGALTPSTSGSISMANVTGTYTKVGNLVTITGVFDVSSVSSPAGLLTLTGLPFTSGDNNRNQSAVTIRCVTHSDLSHAQIQAYIVKNTTAIDINYATDVAGVEGVAMANQVIANFSLTVCGSYMIN